MITSDAPRASRLRTHPIERFFNLLGWMGFLLILPIALHVFGIGGPLAWMGRNLGPFGRPSLLILLFFGLLVLRIVFGGDRIIGPLLIGYAVGFLLLATAVEIGFMSGFRDLASRIPFLVNTPLNFLAALAVILLGILLSYLRRLPVLLQLIFLAALPLGFLGWAHARPTFRFPQAPRLSLSEGVTTLAGLIDPVHLKDPKVKDYVQDVVENPQLSPAEKERLIQELRQRIDKLEAEKLLFEKIRAENDQFRQEIEKLQESLQGAAWCAGARGDAEPVASYAEAVRPDTPCVRDFAVHLAGQHPGSFHREGRPDGIPGDTGLRQVCAIHLYLSDAWKYVNDPTITRLEYVSPADRTIALGLSGDCDDFAVLMASCVSAVGGVARIVHGRCNEGGHAWAEVLIGSAADWTRAVSGVRSFYHSPGRPVRGQVDPNGRHWLALDWRVGEYSCADRILEIAWP